MKNYAEIIQTLNATEQTQIKKFMHVLTDKLSRMVLAKVASPNTPICSSELPMKVLSGSKIATMVTLHELESLELIDSKMVLREDGYHRVYHATPLGRKTVGDYMMQEASFF